MAQAAGYSFNADTVAGTTVRDLAGYFLHGTIVDSAAITAGKAGYGNALNCTGGALQIQAASLTYPIDTTGGLAVAAWVKLNTTTAAARCIASGKSSGALDWAFYASNASGNVEMVIEGTAYSSSTSIRDGSWHHVMVVVDKTSGPSNESIKLVVDGTLVLSTSGLTTGLAYSGNATIEAGRNALSGGQALDGIIDDFRWWNDPVDSASWPTIRDNEQVDLQLAIYPFDDATGDDFSIYNRDLTLAGSSSFEAAMYGNALASSAVTAGASAAVNFGDLDRLSITGWMKLTTAPIGSSAPIMAIADTGGSNKFRAVVNTDRTVTCTWVTIYGTFSVTSATALTVGQWARFHLNMNPTYVGVRLDSASQTTVTTGNGVPHLTPTVNDLKTLYVGGDATAGGQVSFDYLTFTRNFVEAPTFLYWSGPPLPQALKPANVARGVYPFNAGSGTVATDLSPAGNTLALTAAGSWVAGVQGTALGSNGTGPGAKDDTLSWSATPIGWSVSGWVKLRASSSGARFLAMRNGGQEVAHVGWLSGFLWTRLYNASASAPGLFNPSAAPITAETWTHFAASCNGQTLFLYLAGKQVASIAYVMGSFASPTVLNVGGSDNDGGSGSVADLDDLALFDTPISDSNVAWLFANPGAFANAPVDVTLATAHETDTAHPVTVSKAATLQTASETDTAHGLTATKAVTLAAASETDTAHPVTVAKTVDLGTASETETAYPLLPAKAVTLVTAAETDTAHPLIPSKTVTLATAHETDTAHPVDIINGGAARVLAVAHETDTAYPVSATKTVTLATAHEIDRAFALIVAGSGPKWPVLTVSNKQASRAEVSHGI